MTFVLAPMPTCPLIVACPPHAPCSVLFDRTLRLPDTVPDSSMTDTDALLSALESALAVVTTIGVALPPPVVPPPCVAQPVTVLVRQLRPPPPPMQMPFVHVC